jgi:hypothetical protein
MGRPALEVADIFRDHGQAWRAANRGHVSLTQIAYNSCRNRHCPKCQGAAAREWLTEREAELLPVPYFHVVFTLPSAIADIAFQNKRAIYNLLLKASAETLLKIAADPKHLGARIAITSVLHSWGSAMTHHPHVHMIVPGGGISLGRTFIVRGKPSLGERWIACRPGFFLPVRVLSKLFRRLMLEKLKAAHAAGKLTFFGALAGLADARAFAAVLKPLRRTKWSSTARPRSPGRRRCWPTWPAILTASPSPTGG